MTNSADIQEKDYQSRMAKFDADAEKFKQKRQEELAKEESEYTERLTRLSTFDPKFNFFHVVN